MMNQQHPHIKGVININLIRLSCLLVSVTLIGCASTQLPKSIFEVNRLEDDRATLKFSRSNVLLAGACLIDLHINEVKVSELARGEEWSTSFLRPGKYSVKTVNGSPLCGSLGFTYPQQINVLPNSVHSLDLKVKDLRFNLIHTVIYEPVMSFSSPVKISEPTVNDKVNSIKDPIKEDRKNNSLQESKCLRLGLSKNSSDYKLCINSSPTD